MNEGLEPVSTEAELRYRGATPNDGPVLHRLVREGGTLELNTPYAYVLLCDHFADTTTIAELDGEVVGFVTAYRPPSHPDAVFVWQIGVHPKARGRGVALGLLQTLARRAGRSVRYLEATVTPDNEPSRRLFTSFARHAGAEAVWSRAYDGALLGDGHEPENLIRIGPLPADEPS